MVKRVEKSGKTKITYKEKSKERTGKVTEGLQKELDALVPPISMRKEHPGEKGEVQVVKKPIERERISRGEPEKKDQVKSAKKKVNPWGIIIGETD